MKALIQCSGQMGYQFRLVVKCHMLLVKFVILLRAVTPFIISLLESDFMICIEIGYYALHLAHWAVCKLPKHPST